MRSDGLTRKQRWLNKPGNHEKQRAANQTWQRAHRERHNELARLSAAKRQMKAHCST